MTVNKKIEARRKELGLSDSEVARKTGLSIHEYYDVELHDDEIFDVVKLRFIKKLCEVLKLDFFDLFNLKCAFCEKGNQFHPEFSFPRNELIHLRRETMGISQDELGDRVGFYGEEVQSLESKSDHIETWVFINIKELSTIINVPFQILLGVKCGKCGR